MARVLMVRSPFGGYAKGAVIDDPDTVATVLAGEDAGNVTPFEVPDAPAEQAEG